MKQIIIGILLLFIIITKASTHITSETIINQKSQNHKNIGGWSPMFFTKYDKTQINEIINLIKDGKIRAIKISYPDDNNKAKKLARHISSSLQTAATDIVIKMVPVSIKDSNVKYNHNQVCVTLYYNNKTFYNN
jgi:hypothetical protein